MVAFTCQILFNGKTFQKALTVPPKPKVQKAPRPQALPRTKTGKLDFPALQRIAAKHEEAVVARAKSCRAAYMKRRSLYIRDLRIAARENAAEYRPLIGTYAEAVEFGLELPPVDKPRVKSWREYYYSCDCRVCSLAEQADRARWNAQARQLAQKSKAVEIDRLNRHWKRWACKPKEAEEGSFPLWVSRILSGELDESSSDREDAQEVRRGVVATSVRQLKTSWKKEAQPFDWAEFYVGAPAIAPDVKAPRRKRRLPVSEPKKTPSPPLSNVPTIPPLPAQDIPEHFSFLTSEARKDRMERKSKLWVQMMSEDDNATIEDKKANVVLQESVEPEVEIIGDDLTNLRKFCVADTHSLPSDMDRWYPINSFSWSITNEKDTQLYAKVQPYNSIVDESKTPNVMFENVLTNILRVRQFVQTDLEFRVILNSSPFNIGQLQLAWLYAFTEDNFADTRQNRAGFSQMDHVIVDASQANSGSLVIPYRSYRPMMPIYDRKEFGYNLAMGALYLNVLNPLRTPTGSSSSVDGTIMVRFTNCTLTGMVPPNLSPIQSQMFSVMTAIEATRWLYQRYADNNRDAPPNPHAPIHQTPTAVGNLACGTNYVEPLMSMRLDPKGQTPHPEGVPDDMTIEYVTRKFGYIETIEIAATEPMGSRVFCYDAAPILQKKYYVKQTRSGVSCYHFPPVAVISQMFGMWRGGIEYRFDFVATKFHQMRLFFCWVPGYSGTAITYEQAKSCAGTYYDLKDDERSLTVCVPYIADRPWWPHRYANGVDEDQVQAPSTFCCFIVNRLVYTNAVTNKIFVNVYMRAGEGFEVAVPVQPSIGLSYNADFFNVDHITIKAVEGYYPWYGGTWSNVEGGSRIVLRYGPLIDHVAQFYGLQECTYYKFEDQDVASTFVITFESAGTEEKIVGTGVILLPIDVDDGYGMAYLGVVKDTISHSDLQNYFYVKKGNKWVKRSPKDYNRDLLLSATNYKTATYYSPSTKNEGLLPTKVPAPVTEDSSDDDFQRIDTQGDNREFSRNAIKFETMPLGGASIETFGESFHSLKDLCRRYQPYLQVPLTGIRSSPGLINVTFPVIPTGLDLQPLTNPFSNSCRDGIIPIILSGYRFFRGGIRLKMIPNITQYVVYVVQVRPDRPVRKCQPRAGGRTIADSMIQHGYATSAQACSVNPVMSVEVPFYLPGSSGLLCRPSADALANSELSRFFSLGEVAISCQAPLAAQRNIPDAAMTVMYCVADDFSAHTFQGFPPMCMVKDAKTGN